MLRSSLVSMASLVLSLLLAPACGGGGGGDGDGVRDVDLIPIRTAPAVPDLCGSVGSTDFANRGGTILVGDTDANDRVRGIYTFTPASQGVRTLDVTAAVRADYDAALPRSSFRFRFPSGTDGDGSEDLVSLYPPGTNPDLANLEVEYRMP